MTDIYNPTDTICSICTPAGQGAIAVIRLSGKDAFPIASKVWKGKDLGAVPSHGATLGEIIDADNRVVDHALATVFRNPRSFTGEDTVEFSVHGSRWIQREVIRALINAGARQALPGEFTQRAFRNGKLDLSQAEAVADLISSRSRAAQRLAMSQMKGGVSSRISQLRAELLKLATLLELELDFSEEDVEFAPRTQLKDIAIEIRSHINRLLKSFSTGNAIKDGIPVAIVGAPNAGKSSLLNILIGDERAIVSDIPGTTRDTIEETIEIDDYLFRFIDTAGIRHTTDTIETIGIERSMAAIKKAHITICVFDATTRPDANIAKAIDAANNLITVVNKCDLVKDLPTDIPAGAIPISAKTGTGISELIDKLRHTISAEDNAEDFLITNQRHASALAEALASINNILTALTHNYPADLIAQEVRQTIHHLSTITGDIPTTEILETVFKNFCIGK